MRKLGWVRPLISHPASYYMPMTDYKEVLPSRFLMQCESLPAFDQGDEPTAAIQAVASALDIVLNRINSSETFHPSPSFLRRQMFNTDASYGGELSLSITDVIRHIQSHGFVSEYECPYDPASELSPLDSELENLAVLRTGTEWEQVSLSLPVFKRTLFDTNPIVFGMVAFDRMADANDKDIGVIRYESKFAWPSSGYAACLTGWDDSLQSFRFRSSFGALWGENGYGWIPYQVFFGSKLTDEHFVLKSVPKL